MIEVTFAFSPTQTDLLTLRMRISDWLADRVLGSGRQNAQSAYHGLQADIDDFSAFPLVSQISLSISGGIEVWQVAGAPAPVIAAEIDAPAIELTFETIFHKHPFVSNLIGDFALADFPPTIYDFFLYLREHKGGVYLQNCVPQRFTIQFNEGNLATLSVTFTGNYAVFMPKNSVEYGGGGAQVGADIYPVANFSTILGVTPLAPQDASFPLRVLSLTFSVTNNITLMHAIPFERYTIEAYSKARRAPRLYNFGYQNAELSFRAFAPENVLHSLAQFPSPIKEITLECYDPTMERKVGDFYFTGKYTDWRVSVGAQSQVQFEWRGLGAGIPLWSFTPAP